MSKHCPPEYDAPPPNITTDEGLVKFCWWIVGGIATILALITLMEKFGIMAVG